MFFDGLHQFVIVGREVCPTTGRRHLQGYLQLCSKKRLTALKADYPARAHWELARGTPEQNVEYCSKEGDVRVHGRMRKKGERTDLAAVINAASQGGMRAVTEGAHNLQAIRVAEYWLKYHEGQREEKPVVVWIWGPSGSGKTTLAKSLCRSHHDNDTYFKTPTTGKWWDGYDGQRNVIIDEFRDEDYKFTTILSLLHEHETRIEHKGGIRQFKPRLVVITSVFEPSQQYTSQPEEPIRQLTRRIDYVVDMRDLCSVNRVKMGLMAHFNNGHASEDEEEEEERVVIIVD